MKKLIIKIGNETHELPYNGETFSFEVSEKYVPKVGDCVKIYLKNTKDEYCGKINKIEQKKIWLKSVGGILYRNLSLCYDYSYIALTQITPEELRAKYAEAGYDWDYESDTVKPLKWMPKVGDCVMISFKDSEFEYFGKISQIIQKEIRLTSSVNKISRMVLNLSLDYDYPDMFLKEITPEELKAKYAEAGYDWDYETNEVKPCLKYFDKK